MGWEQNRISKAGRPNSEDRTDHVGVVYGGVLDLVLVKGREAGELVGSSVGNDSTTVGVGVEEAGLADGARAGNPDTTKMELSIDGVFDRESSYKKEN